MSDLCDVIPEDKDWNSHQRSVIPEDFSSRVSSRASSRRVYDVDRSVHDSRRDMKTIPSTTDNSKKKKRRGNEEGENSRLMSYISSNSDHINDNNGFVRKNDKENIYGNAIFTSADSKGNGKQIHSSPIGKNADLRQISLTDIGNIYGVDDEEEEDGDDEWDFKKEIGVKERTLKKGLDNVRNVLKSTLSLLRQKERRIAQLEDVLRRLRSKLKNIDHNMLKTCDRDDRGHMRRTVDLVQLNGHQQYSNELDTLRHENRALKRELEKETELHRIVRNERDIAADSAEDLRVKFQKLKEDYDVILCTADSQRETLEEFKNHREGVKGKYEERLATMDIKYQSLSDQCNDLKRIKSELEDDLSKSQRKQTELKLQNEHRVLLESAEVRKLQQELTILEEKMHAAHLSNIRLIRIMANTRDMGHWMRKEYSSTPGDGAGQLQSFTDYIFIPPSGSGQSTGPTLSTTICAKCSSIIIPGSSDGDIYSGNYHDPNYITTRSKNTYLNGTMYPRRTGIGVSRNGNEHFMIEDFKSQQLLSEAIKEEDAYFNEFSLTDANRNKLNKAYHHGGTSSFGERLSHNITDTLLTTEGSVTGHPITKAAHHSYRDGGSSLVYLDSKTAQRKARLLASTLSSLIDLKTESNYWIPHAIFVEAQKFRGALATNIVAAAMAAYNAAVSSSTSFSATGSSFNLFDDLLPVSAFFSFLIKINSIWRDRVSSRDIQSRGRSSRRRNNISTIASSATQGTARDNYPSLKSSSSFTAGKKDGINISYDDKNTDGLYSADTTDGCCLTNDDLTVLRKVDRNLAGIRMRVRKLPRSARIGDIIAQYESLVINPYKSVIRNVVFSQREKDKEWRHSSQIPGGNSYAARPSNAWQSMADELIITKFQTLRREISKITERMRESLCGASHDVQKFLDVIGGLIAEKAERKRKTALSELSDYESNYRRITSDYDDGDFESLSSEYDVEEEEGKEALIPLMYRVISFLSNFAVEVDKSVMEATDKLEQTTIDALS